MATKSLWALISRDFVIELRNKNSINSILLYLSAVVFVAYMALNARNTIIGLNIWNAVFWVILAFLSVNVVSKSFSRDSNRSYYYLYQVVNPQEIVGAKILFNAVYIVFTSVALSVAYFVLLGSPQYGMGMFMFTVSLSSIALGVSLSMISAIASKTNNSTGMTAVLGLPLMLPVLLIAIKMSQNALNGFSWSTILNESLILLSLICLSIAVAYILFRYIWRS